MQYVYPDYYDSFHCIADKCRHSCCIGWEIDIDPSTLEYYEGIQGAFGARLKSNISYDDTPHFSLGENERCPFLDERGLCDIIIELGEENICSICTDHPRFRNELPGRIETGLGLCCEEAARLILSKKTPTVLNISGDFESADDIVSIRDEAVSLMHDRTITIEGRLEKMLELCGAAMPEKNIDDWCTLFASLERLDDSWTKMLDLLRSGWQTADYEGFDTYIADRTIEYEQLIVYLLYRHLANAASDMDLAARAAFAALIYMLLRTMGAVIWTQTGEFTFEQQAELARLFSSEIEYSDENLDIILDELCF